MSAKVKRWYYGVAVTAWTALGVVCTAGVDAPATRSASTVSPPTATAAGATSSPVTTPLNKTSDPVTTIIRCGTLVANSVQSGQGAGPNTFELRSATGVILARFLWPGRQSELGTYLCARLIAGAPMAGFDALVRPGEPGYVAEPTGSAPAPASVTDQVTINGRAYRIAPESPYLWRDFMPISPPGGRPLAASIRVVAVDGGSFPPDITVDRVWVHGPSVWETAPADVRRSPEAGTPPSQIEVFANEGPKWEPGIEVDVVIRLVSGGASYFLRATAVEIRRTT